MQTLQQDLQLNKGLIPEKNSIKKGAAAPYIIDDIRNYLNNQKLSSGAETSRYLILADSFNAKIKLWYSRCP